MATPGTRWLRAKHGEVMSRHGCECRPRGGGHSFISHEMRILVVRFEGVIEAPSSSIDYPGGKLSGWVVHLHVVPGPSFNRK